MAATRVYGVGGKLLKGVQRIYVDRIGYVGVLIGICVSEWFVINVVLIHCFAMYPRLFNVCMDHVVLKVYAKALAKGL